MLRCARLLVVLCGILASEALAQDRMGGPTSKPDSLEQKAIADKIRETLKDPYSAQFTFDRWSEPKSSFTGQKRNVCGSVNAKNSYGGYVGKRLWRVTTSRAGDNFDLSDLIVASVEEENAIILEHCLKWIVQEKNPSQ